ncbi:MAG: Eco47II family restriction endonuclease, partial [Casimicrobium sp.]
PFESWQVQEEARQLQKTFEHQMGYLHQRVLGSIDAWEDLETGNVTDLVCKSRKICAEVKNKHNTVKKSDEAAVYDKLQGLVGSSGAYRGFTAYFVAIVPERTAAIDEPFAPSNNASGVRKTANPKIRRMDGYSFYALATGRPHALEELFAALPHAVAAVTGKHAALDPKFSDLFEAAYGRRR